MNIYSNYIHNLEKLGISQITFNYPKVRLSVIESYNGVLLRNLKEVIYLPINTDITLMNFLVIISQKCKSTYLCDQFLWHFDNRENIGLKKVKSWRRYCLQMYIMSEFLERWNYSICNCAERENNPMHLPKFIKLYHKG